MAVTFEAGRQAREPVRLEPLPRDGALAPVVRGPVLAEARVAAQIALDADYWRLRLDAPDIAGSAEPGQFVMLTVAEPGAAEPVLPRPMAIYDWDEESGTIEIVYRVVGNGTARLTRLSEGDVVPTVGPLGRGFVLPPGARRILLLGRGIGTCSLTALARRAADRGIRVSSVASARERPALVGRDAYAAAGADPIVEVVDDDGSSAIELLAPRLRRIAGAGIDEIYTCGSSRLLELAVDLGASVGAGVQVSLEAHMACGLGFCHGCASGHPGLAAETPLVCADGPVFRWASSPGTAGAAAA